jgi:hypothetical protein
VRKRIVIGVVAAVLIGVGAYVLPPPRNSVEYHIRAYREAERRLTAKETVIDELRDVWRKIRSKRMGRLGRLRWEMMEHKQELVRLGYLEDQTFDVTTGTVTTLMAAVQKAVLKKGTNYEFFSAGTVGTTAVYAITVKGMMPSREEVVTELDRQDGVPETK